MDYITGMNLRYFATHTEKMTEATTGHEYGRIAINSLICAI